MQTLLLLFGTWQMQTIVILVAIDVVLGILAAIYRKEFVWGKLANFTKGMVLTYILGFAIIEVVGAALSNLAFIVPFAFALIVITLFASIARNLAKFGLPLPGALKK